MLAALHCRVTDLRVAAERGLLAALDGSCRTPIAALALLGDNDALSLEALVALPDGRETHRIQRTGLASQAAELGNDAGEELKSRAGPDFLSW